MLDDAMQFPIGVTFLYCTPRELAGLSLHARLCCRRPRYRKHRQPPRRHTAVEKVITISEPRRQGIIKSNPPLKVLSVFDQASGRDEKIIPNIGGRDSLNVFAVGCILEVGANSNKSFSGINFFHGGVC